MASTVWPWRARLPGLEDAPHGPVHDGDTIVLLIDRGFDDIKRVRVRLAKLYAPETHEVGGDETATFACRWLATHRTPVRWPFLLETTRTAGDVENTTLSRYLGTVFTADRTACLNSDIAAYIAARGYGPGRT